MRNFHLPGRSVAYATTAMAATSSPAATLAALQVLRTGGNAVDAAITASAVLCVVEPHMTGIGGDCFALIGKADGTIIGLNGSGRSPLAADAAWLQGAGLTGGIAGDSVHAVTVPGAIDAWDRMLRDHGTISLAEALGPAVRTAEAGFAVAPRVAWDWARYADKLATDEGARQHYLVDGRAPREGEVFRSPALARTLRLIARYGRETFYEGEIADDMVAHLRSLGGLHGKEDFTRAHADYVEPISSDYADHQVVELPPNGQGVTALIALNVLRRFDLGRLDPSGPERCHLQIEALRLAFELRNRHIADPAFHEVPVGMMLSDATAEELAGRIDPKHRREGEGDDRPPAGSDTVYLTVVDKDRTAVSFINSIYHGFGSGICTPKTGIMLHNRGMGFTTDPAHPNCIGPGKRPLHTIIPALIRRGGDVVVSYGVMGGAYQPMGHVQVAVNMLTYGMDIQAAIDAPRFFHQDGVVGVEKGLPEATVRALAAMGHNAVPVDQPFGGGQGIVINRETGVLAGGSDPRKDGVALGF